MVDSVNENEKLYEIVRAISQLYEQNSLVDQMIDIEGSNAQLISIRAVLYIAINQSCLLVSILNIL